MLVWFLVVFRLWKGGGCWREFLVWEVWFCLLFCGEKKLVDLIGVIVLLLLLFFNLLFGVDWILIVWRSLIIVVIRWEVVVLRRVIGVILVELVKDLEVVIRLLVVGDIWVLSFWFCCVSLMLFFVDLLIFLVICWMFIIIVFIELIMCFGLFMCVCCNSLLMVIWNLVIWMFLISLLFCVKFFLCINFLVFCCIGMFFEDLCRFCSWVLVWV